MGVTIKDVAKRTGLSITTVSLVLNKKESRIPEKTRQIIEDVAHELNYVPNQAAVSLSTKKTNLIALVIPRKSLYFFANLISSVESSCRNAGYGLNISMPDGDEESCMEAIREALRRGTDGVIFDTSFFRDDFSKTYTELVKKSDSPICLLSRIGKHIFPNSIIPDHRQGGFTAASHLIESGHSKIGLISGPEDSNLVSDLQKGIGSAFEGKGQSDKNKPELYKVSGEDTAAFGYDGLKNLLGKTSKITGIIAGSVNIAAGVLRRAREMDLSIPEQLSVLAYGDPLPGTDYPITLSTVSVHYDRIARKAVNLMKKLDNGAGDFEGELVPPSLVSRGSVTKCSTVKKR